MKLAPSRYVALDASLLVGMGLLAAVMISSALLTHWNLQALREDTRWVSHTHEVLDSLSRVFHHAQGAEIGQRGFLLTGENQYLEPYQVALTNLDQEIRETRRLTADNSRQAKRIEELQGLLETQLENLADQIRLRRNGVFEAAQAGMQTHVSKQNMDSIRAKITEIDAAERTLLDERKRKSNTASQQTIVLNVLTVLIGLIGVGAFLVLLNRNLQFRAITAAEIHEDREQLRITLQSIGDGVIVTDPQGRVTFLNPTAQELCGWSQAEAAGQPLEQVFLIVHEDTRASVENPAIRALQDGVIVGLANHTLLISRDGTERAIADSAAPILGLNHELRGAVLVFRDVSEDRASERELRHSEARKAAILETSMDAIISCDAQGEVVEFNSAAERMFGYSRAEAMGQELAELIVPPHLREQHYLGMKRYQETGQSSILNRRMELSGLKANGEEFPAEIAIARITGDGPIVFTAYIRDLTLQKQAERDLGNRLKLLELTADVSRSLATRSSLEEMLQGCAEALIHYLDGAVARIWTLNETGTLLDLEASAGISPEMEDFYRQIPYGQFKIGMIARERRPHLTNSVIGDPLVREQEWAKREGLVSFAGYPLLVADRLVGVISLFAKHPMDQQTLDVIATVANEIAVSIDQQRSIRKVAESQRLLQVTLSSIGDAVLTTDIEGRITFLNAIAESLTGWTVAEATGLSVEEVFQIVNEETNEPVENPVRRVLEEGIIVGLANHTVLIAKDGQRRPIDDSGAPIRVEGDLVGTVLVFRDVTDRQKAERLLNDQNEVLQQMVRGADLKLILENLCQTTRQQLTDAAVVTVMRVEEETQSLQPVAGAALPLEWYQEGELVSLDQSGSVCLLKETQVILDLEQASHPTALQKLALQHNLKGCWSTPIFSSRHEILGTLAIFHPTPYHPTSRDLQFASIVAQTAGLAIERQQIDASLRSSEERVRMALTAARMVAWEYFPRTDRGIVSANAAELFGLAGISRPYSLQEFQSLIHPDDRIARHLAIQQAMEEHKPFLQIFRLIRPNDQGIVWVEERGKPINGDDGLCQRVVCVMTDISVRVENEKILHRIQTNAAMALSVAQLGTWTWTVATNEVTVDKRTCEVAGIEEIETISLPEISERVHPDDWPHVEQSLRRALNPEGNGFYVEELRFVHEDGEERWVIAHGQTIFSGVGESRTALQILGTVLDITERKRTEEHLQRLTQETERQRRFYDTILSNVADLVYVFDHNYRFTYANQALLATWGKTAEQAIGKTCLELGYEPWHAEMHSREIDFVINNGQPYRGEVPFTGTTGRRIYDYIMVPVFGADGTVEAVAGTTRDVTDRKQMEEDLRSAAADLSEANRRKNEFLATLAHELRNPLAPIRTGLELMKLSVNDPVTLEDTRSMMERQIHQMVRLIDDLLDISRITQGKLQLRKCRVQLPEIIRSSVEAVRPLIDEAEHQLTVNMPPDTIELEADPNRLAQIVSNLLSNAAKYTRDKGQISLSASLEGNSAVIRVSDNGIGIPAEMQHAIFEMFTQIDRPLEKGYTGLGIGLTLVKRLVEMHEGTIEVHSEGQNRGSEFIVKVPAVEAESSKMTSQAPATPQPVRSLKILVVDDNKSAAEMMRLVLKMMGHDVRMAHDGLEAVEITNEFRPHVVLMDLGMPRLNGYEAAKRIRESEWGAGIILVALTGWGQDEDKQRTRDAGFDHHLTKPAEPSALQQLLASLEPPA